jgi:hypothetical protein
MTKYDTTSTHRKPRWVPCQQIFIQRLRLVKVAHVVVRQGSICGHPIAARKQLQRHQQKDG